jgi:phenylalanyl-tRNA synthetase alpha chain
MLTPQEYSILKQLSTKNSLLLSQIPLGARESYRHSLLELEKSGLVSLDKLEAPKYKLSTNAESVLIEGFPEKILIRALPQDFSPINQDSIPLSKDVLNIAIGFAKQRGWLALEKKTDGTYLRLTPEGKKALLHETPEESILKKIKNSELEFTQEEQAAFERLQKRQNFIIVGKEIDYLAKITEKGLLALDDYKEEKHLGALTPEILRSKAWVNKKLRPFDVSSPVLSVNAGRIHPLKETISQIRQNFLDLGFQEMSGPLLETAFWNMDSMFIPQDHPAREIQDTFYLGKKGELPKNPKLLQKISRLHLEYGYKWNPELARELLLRTHTTATSFRKLYSKPKQPCKYFYISKVFRNETLDATHLPEFHQCEGFVIAKKGENLTLEHLMGMIKEFYARMGITKIKFKPTYNPYTEPSMEAYGYYKGFGWLELINSGIFRPEALEPYGIKETVIAWGLGIERLAMIKHQIKDIRKISGTTADLDWLRNYKATIQ